MKARVAYSVPILKVKDVERSVRFYELLGFEATSVLRTEEGVAYWANLSCFRGNPEVRTSENESAAEMVSLGEDTHSPIDGSMQAASLYLFTKGLEGLRAELIRNGVEVSEIVKREYMPKGEMEQRDPDGWRVFVGGV